MLPRARLVRRPESQAKSTASPVPTIVIAKYFRIKSPLIDVAVHALWVRKQHKHWREEKERNRVWASFSDAAKLVREPGLKKLFNEMAEHLPDEPVCGCASSKATRSRARSRRTIKV
jgi:hypothetical protein